MAVKLELYRVFQEVARMGNISAAAQNLFISQSAVSQSIKQLEEQLQVRLFSRSTRGVVLTSEGKLLLDYVSHGLGLIQCGEEKLAQSRQLLTGELIIGASDTVTKTYLVSRLEAFHQNYPAIQIRILNGTSQMVLDYLHAGQVDIAFASEPKDKDAYSVRHCFDTHQIFVAAPNYDCDFDHVHTMQEIAAFPLILLERKASSRVYVEQFFQQHGVSIKPEIELGSHNLLISLARIGLGVACVTEEFSQSGLSRGVILPLHTEFEIPPRSVCMCTLRDVAQRAHADGARRDLKFGMQRQNHAPAKAGLREFLRHTGNAKADAGQRDEQIVGAELDLRLDTHAVLLEKLLDIDAGAGLALQQNQREGRDLLHGMHVVKIAVIIRRGDEDLVRVEAVADGIRILVLRLAGKGNVDLTGMQIVEHHLTCTVQDPDLDGGIILVKRLKTRDQIGLRDRIACADDEFAREQLARLRKLFLSALDEAQPMRNIVEKKLSLARQDDAARAA